MKQMRQKMADYTRFGQVLLAISTILMIGLILPNGGKEMTQIYTMMGTIVAFLGGAFFFFFRVKKIREQIEELEHEEAHE
ncbi:MAG: YrhC family protein [Ectobacillus sp.]